MRATSIVLVGLLMSNAVGAATFEFRFTDGAGEGFNDTTPFTPVGGNTATTLGAARRAVMQEAGRVWGLLLQSNVPIIVDAAFDPLNCTATSATLGQAGATLFFGPPDDQTVTYASALADALQGADQMAATQTPNQADIVSTFNSSINGTPTCLAGNTFYLGFDHNRGVGQVDLLAVVLHELSHGLGFIPAVNLTTGNTFASGRFTSYAQQLFDEELNQSWPLLTSQERLQSAANTGDLAWNGTNARRYRNRLSSGVTPNGRIRMFAPATIAPGSSVSHWDTVATPNLLMEPNITAGLTSRVDFTTCAFRDIGWTVTRCPDLTNAAPTIQAQTFTATEDTARAIVIAGTDGDNDTLTFTVATNPTRGTLSGTSPNFTYTPNANLNGNDTFTVTASDGVDTSAAATITVAVAAVNDAPTASPTTATVQAGSSVTIPGVGTDIDGDALTYSIVSQAANGNATASGTTITYTANGTFSGTDTFTYRANDPNGGSSAPATVTVTVTPPPRSGGGGGGGNMGVIFVVLLSVAAAARRLRGGSKA